MSMKMLSKAVMMASLSVASLAVLPTYAAISMDSDEKATLVEKRLQYLNEQNSLFLEQLSTHPFVEDVAYEFGKLSHDPASESASATSELTVKLNEALFDIDETIKFTFSEQVDYSNALNEQDILARVTSKIAFKEDSAGFSELTDEEKDEIAAYFARMELQTDLLEGSAIKQYFYLPDIYVEGNDEEPEFKFGGIKVQADYDEEFYAKGAGDIHVEVGEISFSEMQEMIDYDALMALSQEEQDNLSYEDYPMIKETIEVLDMQPFTLDYTISPDGDLKLDSSPIVMAFEDGEGTMVIERLTGEGKVSYDEDIAQYLGTQHYTAHNFSIESYELPAPIVIEKLDYILSLDRADNDLFNMDSRIIVTPESASFDMLTDGMFSIKSLEFGFNGENFSQETIEHFMTLNSHAVDVDFYFEEDGRELIESLLKSLSNDGATAGFDLTFSTDKGQATVDSFMTLDKGTDAQKWVDAFENEDAEALEKLVNDDLLYEAKVTVPITLLDAVGMTEMAQMMGAPYVVMEGDNLVIHVQNKGEGPLINGRTLEELESGM